MPSFPTFPVSLGDTAGKRAVPCSWSSPHQLRVVAGEWTFPWSYGWEDPWKGEVWIACHTQADLEQLVWCYQLGGETFTKVESDHATRASKSVECWKASWCSGNPSLMVDQQCPLCDYKHKKLQQLTPAKMALDKVMSFGLALGWFVRWSWCDSMYWSPYRLPVVSSNTLSMMWSEIKSW